MTQIQILNIKRNLTAGYVEVTYKMSFTLPAIYGTGANPIYGLSSIIQSFPDGFSLEVIPVTGTVIVLNETKSVPSSVTLAQVQSQLQTRYTNVRAQLDALTLTPYDSAVGQSFDGSVWASAANITDNAIVNVDQLNLSQSATGAAGAALTVTLPAVVQKFHNVIYLEITAYSSAARTGSATPIVVTTTNLANNPSFTFATAAAIGTTDKQLLQLPEPIKALSPNTAVTIVCPATANIIWRVNCFYYLTT